MATINDYILWLLKAVQCTVGEDQSRGAKLILPCSWYIEMDSNCYLNMSKDDWGRFQKFVDTREDREGAKCSKLGLLYSKWAPYLPNAKSVEWWAQVYFLGLQLTLGYNLNHISSSSFHAEKSFTLHKRAKMTKMQ